MTDPIVLSAEERLARVTRNALQAWEDAGAPLARGYGEGTRQNLRGWPDNGASTREVYRLAVHFMEQEKVRLAREEADRAMTARRAAQLAAKEQMVAEMIEIREELGLTQAEMNAELDLKSGVIKNAENRGASYGNDFVEKLLLRYRAKAKLAGKGGIGSAES